MRAAEVDGRDGAQGQWSAKEVHNLIRTTLSGFMVTTPRSDSGLPLSGSVAGQARFEASYDDRDKPLSLRGVTLAGQARFEASYDDRDKPLSLRGTLVIKLDKAIASRIHIFIEESRAWQRYR